MKVGSKVGQQVVIGVVQPNTVSQFKVRKQVTDEDGNVRTVEEVKEYQNTNMLFGQLSCGTLVDGEGKQIVGRKQ